MLTRSANGDEEELLTGAQVIDRLVQERRFRMVAAKCVLPALRFGDEWRFRKSDLERWIERQGTLSSLWG